MADPHSILPTEQESLEHRRRRVRVAFVGAGPMAREHVRAFADVPGAELSGIYSRTRSKAQALALEFGIRSVCGSLDELWDVTGHGLVVVAVSVAAARNVCLEVFRHPWSCLIEKPIGYNLEEAEEIATAARRLDRSAFAALNRRHLSSTRALLERINQSGEPRVIQVWDQEDPSAARAAGHPEMVVANWMYANSIHCVDLISILGRGDIVLVEPIVRWIPESPRFVAAKVVFSSGDVALYEAIWDGPGPWAVAVTTHSERWELRPLEQASVQLRGSRTPERVPVDDWDKQFKPGLRVQAEAAMIAACGGPRSLPGLQSAVQTMRLVKAIYAT